VTVDRVSPESVREAYRQAAHLGVAPMLLSGSPWLIDRDVWPSLLDAARLPAPVGLAIPPAAAPAQPQGGVAVIPLTGVITPQGSFLSFLFGGSPGGLLTFREQLDAAMASSDVSSILIDVDSPGGLVDQVPETAAAVRAAAAVKNVVAVADTKALSAAYWIASQASEVVVTPSGYAGSIGVYRVHVDESGLNDQLGLKVTYVSAGKFKTEGNPDEPLDETAQEAWQTAVDDLYGQFVGDVARGRKTSAEAVRAGFGEGRSLGAQRAVDAGLADRVATFDDVLSELLGSAPGQAVEPAAALATLEARCAAIQAELVRARTPEEARKVLGLPDPAAVPPAVWGADERAYRARLLTAR
jgi:signal peptide peptidase SppA